MNILFSYKRLLRKTRIVYNNIQRFFRMSLQFINNFYTPIKHDYKSISWHQKLTEFVDFYFYLGGRVAVAISPCENGKSQSVQFQSGPGIGWHSLAKIISYAMVYFRYFFNENDLTSFHGSRITKILIGLSYFPVCMLAAKVALRLIFHSYLFPSIPAHSKSSLSLEDFSRINEALGEIKYPSFFHLLRFNYNFNRSFLTNINKEKVWVLTVLQLFKNAYIEDGCHPFVTWENVLDDCSDGLDISIQQGPEKERVYQSDCVNHSNHQVRCLSFKRKLNQLTSIQISELFTACLLEDLHQTLDVEVYECLEDLIAVTNAIYCRYSLLVSNRNYKDIKDLIYEKLLRLFEGNFNQMDADLEILQDSDFASKICDHLILDLLSNAKIQGETLIINRNIFLNFSQHNHEEEDISFCKFNALNSKNMLEDPYITNHPLIIAKCLKENKPFHEIQETMEYVEFRKLVKKRYYDAFCSQWIILAQPQQKIIYRPSISSSRQIISNDYSFNKIMFYINNQFQIIDSDFYVGSCFLAALSPDYEKNVNGGEKKILEIRSLIAEKILENKEQYYDYVIVIPNFLSLHPITQERLKMEYWAISTDSSLENKVEAIRARAEQVQKLTTYLKEVEFAIVAQIINCPIWIYKKQTKDFSLDKNSKIEPHVRYGENLSGDIRYLLDDSNHYKSLKPLATNLSS